MGALKAAVMAWTIEERMKRSNGDVNGCGRDEKTIAWF